MVVEMKKLNLVAMAYDRNDILNALERTGAVEVKQHAPSEYAHALSCEKETLEQNYSEAESALQILLSQVHSYASDHKISYKQKEEIDVPYSQFMSAGENEGDTATLIAKVNGLWDERNGKKAELNRLSRALKAAEVYSQSSLPFSAYTQTQTVVYKLGTLEPRSYEKLAQEFGECALIDHRVISNRDVVVLGVCLHKSVLAEGEKLLSEAGFAACPYHSEETGAQLCDSLRVQIKALEEALEENGAAFFALADEISALKIYSDYLHFEIEKSSLSDKMLATNTTFLLEAYVPVTGEASVKETLEQTTGAVYYEFSPVPEDEMPPTLLKNNTVVEGFESLTNMYSVPNAREFDPNSIMAVFYSIFLGFIMADIGYGLLMFFLGGLMWFKGRKRPTTMSRLAGVFSVGGIFAVVWGFLFNSLFGVGVLPFTLMPSPKDDMWALAGIRIPSVLILCMLFGIVHLGAGYVCKAVQCWRRGQIVDGLLDGLLWAVFSAGVFLAVLGFVDEFALSVLMLPGAIIAGAMLVIAIFTAGRKEKLLGKFTKGFGAAYGIINYVSDVLSYARLYGLMLSGAVIGNLISGYAITGMNGGVGFLFSGNVGFVILGVVLILVGHAFNLAISLLGAYIHDARLQYVEFYGKFFEGEGELFSPLGSNKKYVRVISD